MLPPSSSYHFVWRMNVESEEWRRCIASERVLLLCIRRLIIIQLIILNGCVARWHIMCSHSVAENICHPWGQKNIINYSIINSYKCQSSPCAISLPRRQRWHRYHWWQRWHHSIRVFVIDTCASKYLYENCHCSHLWWCARCSPSEFSVDTSFDLFPIHYLPKHILLIHVNRKVSIKDHPWLSSTPTPGPPVSLAEPCPMLSSN